MMIVPFVIGLALSSSAPTIVGTATVIDGDTIEIHEQRIRLHGIDAIESGQPCTEQDGSPWRCGQSAANALADRIGRAPVQCEPRDVDRYHRVVAVCYRDGADLNAWMVHEGWAVAYRHYSMDYVADEDQARQARRGMWRADFMMPWDWRHSRKSAATDGLPEVFMRLTKGSHSCTPRKTCKAMNSCEEALWMLKNCSWGGALDRDNDGTPCEAVC